LDLKTEDVDLDLDLLIYAGLGLEDRGLGLGLGFAGLVTSLFKILRGILMLLICTYNITH